MTPREEVQQQVLAARDAAVSTYALDTVRLAMAVNAAFARVGSRGNNDAADLVQIAALVMAMAEIKLLARDAHKRLS